MPSQYPQGSQSCWTRFSPGALARHLDQAELGDLQDVGARLVGANRVLQRTVHPLAVVGGLHVDQVDDDQATYVSEAQLMHHFFDSFEVGAENRFF